MKKLLERQVVFTTVLRMLSFLARRSYLDGLTQWVTRMVAQLNLLLNKPPRSESPSELAETWRNLMPLDGQENFTIEAVDDKTAYTQIHLHCPLRGTGDVHACYKLMNYDRALMRKVGGELIVLESQSNSGKPYCRLAIRPLGGSTTDLVPAHER